MLVNKYVHNELSEFYTYPSLLVCQGCCNGNAIDWVAYKQQRLLTVPETGNSKIKSQAGSVSIEGPFVLRIQSSSPHCICTCQEVREDSGVSFIKTPILSLSAP